MRQVIDKNVGVVIATEKMQRAKTGVSLKVRQGRNTQRDGAVPLLNKSLSLSLSLSHREGGKVGFIENTAMRHRRVDS